MIEKSSALRIQRLALDAIVALTESLNVAIESASSPDTLDQLKRGVGLSIGTIDSELLSVLYKMYPEIDHLKQ